MNEVYIMSATRTAIGTFGGSLKDYCPVDAILFLPGPFLTI